MKSQHPDYRIIATKLRYLALRMSTIAGSGHPTSSLSSADLMAVYFSTYFRYDFQNPKHPGNDRLIFSKGHATPLYYALFTIAGAIEEKDIDHYRKFTSILEGHPTFRFPYAEAATGSLGQGLSIGVGYALNSKYLDKTDSRTVVLIGDGEMAEGSVWEAMAVASKYKLDNLTGIIDVNRLGQSDETMLGYDVVTYEKRIESFGWNTIVLDGHNYQEIVDAFLKAGDTRGKPSMIIAKTVKGKGVSFLEDKNGWHGKSLTREEFDRAVKELGVIDSDLQVEVRKPESSLVRPLKSPPKADRPRAELKSSYQIGDQVATRKAYGDALAMWAEIYPEVVALDGDVKNSTYAEIFKAKFPDRFFEMYIAEQNMAGTAVGFARSGKIPFVSTFAAFFTRCFDQIRMGALSGAGVKFCGSHAGVSIGEDGPSQMGLEDIAMFRTIQGCSILYPCDAVSTFQLVGEMAKTPGMVYMRTTRPPTPVIYSPGERFPIGGSKIHRLPVKSLKGLKKLTHKVVIIAAGITLFESLKAQAELALKSIEAIVIDCYSVKPLDGKTLRKLAGEVKHVIVVEDHWFEGGLGDAVLNELIGLKDIQVKKLAVTKLPRSGKSQELMDFEGISAKSIVKEAVALVK